jgi:crotonobetainyl-CoA:carnitine CoA-transferase CaiB-like acyl-CoA transferase
MVAYLWPEGMSALNYVGNEADPARGQMGLDLVFKTQDGYITAGAVTDREWAGMCRAFGREDLTEDPRFATPAARFKNITERRALMSSEVGKWPSEEILARLVAEQVPCAPILSREALLDNEQVMENEIIEVHDDPVLGPVRQPRPAARFTSTPATVRALAPFLGADNADILGELGYAVGDIEKLHGDGVLAKQGGSDIESEGKGHG